jgi:hypothetical protein
VPLAVGWGVLGVWLGRRQEREARHRLLPIHAENESAPAQVKSADGLLHAQHP